MSCSAPFGADRQDEVAACAPALRAYYNEPHNRAMLAHEAELSLADVVEHYGRLSTQGGRGFLLERDGRLVGDADLRHVEGGTAEVAILIGERAAQGRGLGTRFGVMVHAFAFRALGLARLYASIIPSNAASLRLFAKLGYEPDDSPAARRTIDEPDDVTLSLSADRFAALHGALAAQGCASIEAAPRTHPAPSGTRRARRGCRGGMRVRVFSSGAHSRRRSSRSASSGGVAWATIGCGQLLPQMMRSGAWAMRAFARWPTSS